MSNQIITQSPHVSLLMQSQDAVKAHLESVYNAVEDDGLRSSLVYVHDKYNELMQFFVRTDLILVGAEAKRKATEEERDMLLRELECAREDAADGYDTGYSAGYAQATDDLQIDPDGGTALKNIQEESYQEGWHDGLQKASEYRRHMQELEDALAEKDEELNQLKALIERATGNE